MKIAETCKRKLQFGFRKDAKNFLRRRNLHHTQRVYKCKMCKQFHTTSSTAKELQMLRDNDVKPCELTFIALGKEIRRLKEC